MPEMPPTQDRTLKVGIIGAGGHSSDQIFPCLPFLPAKLVAVCDLDRTRAERNAEVYGGRVYTDHAEMLREADLDAVVVCVGPKEHPQLAIDVLEAGIPVWTEKPPACSVADVQAMQEAGNRTGRICMTGFMKRFAPVYRRAREAVLSEEFGAPSLLSIDWSLGVDDKGWQDIFLLDFGVHMLDLARFFFGEVAEVFAATRAELSYAVTLSFVNGAVGTISMTVNRGFDVTEEVKLAGDYGNYLTIDSVGRLNRYHQGRIADQYDRPLALQDSLRDIGYLGQLVEFLAAVREKREPEASIESSCQTMRLYEAICRSAAEGLPVRIEQS